MHLESLIGASVTAPQTKKALRKSHNLINLTPEEYLALRNNKDVIPAWNKNRYSGAQKLYRHTLILALNLVKRLEKKTTIKERVTDAHFDRELKYLVEDKPLLEEGLTANGFIRKN